MRWGELSYKFARPIRWLVALADEEVIPFEIAEVKTDRETRGHRFLGSYIRLSNANEYEAKLKENYCIPNPKVSEEIIVDQLKELEIKQNIKIIIKKDLISEIHYNIKYINIIILYII